MNALIIDTHIERMIFIIRDHKVMLHFNQETEVQQGQPPKEARTLQRFYHYKPLMGEMRQRIKYVRKHWDVLTPEQRQLVRAAWIKTHPPRVKRRRLLHRPPRRHRSKTH